MKIKLILATMIMMIWVFGIPHTQAFQLQDWMEKTYLDHQSKKLLKDMVKWSDKGWNIHISSVRLARQNAVVWIKSSIDLIINEFRTSVWQNCALTYDDAATLLVKNKQFKRFLNRIKDTEPDFKYKLDDSTFTVSCIRYLNCANNYQKEWNILSSDEYNQCVGGISDKFNKYFSSQYGKNQLGSYSYGDEVFVNGTLQDSSFDLMYDIEQINKILYADPKRIPNYYLWGPPDYLSKTSWWDKDNAQAMKFTARLVPSKLFAWNIAVPNIEDAIAQIQVSQDDSNIVSNLQCFEPTAIIQSDDAKIFKQEVQRLKKAALDLEESKLIEMVIGTVSQPFLDEPPQPIPGAQLPPELLNPSLNEEGDWNSADDRWDGEPPSPGQGEPWDTNNEQNNCPTKTSDVTEQFDLQGDKPNIKACLQSCNQCAQGIQRTACYSQCLCTTFTNSAEFATWLGGTTIGMRLCVVPSRTPDIITPWTQVVSIQEIINAISALVSKLKESGQYIPSSKPSEFFSPTVKVKKLVDAFNFTVNTITKSKYRSPDKKVNASDQVHYFDTQVPDISQLHIESMMKQNEWYADFIQIQKDFWEQMGSILKDRDQTAQKFYQQVNSK